MVIAGLDAAADAALLDAVSSDASVRASLRRPSTLMLAIEVPGVYVKPAAEVGGEK